MIINPLTCDRFLLYQCSLFQLGDDKYVHEILTFPSVSDRFVTIHWLCDDKLTIDFPIFLAAW